MSRRFTFFALLASLSQGATAVLDCMGDSATPRPGKRGAAQGREQLLPLDNPRKLAAIQFRSTSLKGWRASGAQLVIHFERGSCQGRMLAGYQAKFDEAASVLTAPAKTVPAPCKKLGAGWWQLDLPASLAQQLVDHPDGAIILSHPARNGPIVHSRETLSFTPRLMVEGDAAP